MLGVGIDWAEEFHDVALGTAEEGVVEQFRIEHGPAGVARLIGRCLDLEPDPGEVRVVLETRHGLLVEALLDAGFTVVPVNPDLVAPDLVARRRGPARKKDDAEDARRWERRLGELLLGAPRTGRDHTAKDPDPPNAFPGGEIYLSFPGLGDRLAARVAGEIGEHITQYDTPSALACYAGRAPVTRRSGKNDFVVARRLAHNRYLGDAVHQRAFCSLSLSGWAREFYDAKIAAGKSHHNALRAPGNRWLEILWHCLTRGVHYDENIHTANRNRALGRAA